MLTINLLEGVPGYLFGPMCPDAGYVPCFELLPYADGVIINYPDNGNWQVLPPFVDQPRLNDAYQEAEEWSAMIHCNTVGKLNKIIDLGYAEKIIQVAEALHEKKLANIADILASHHELKLVLIAGPSSSGKTSTAQRLSIQMAVNGLRPIAVSMDDYYKFKDGINDIEIANNVSIKVDYKKGTYKITSPTAELNLTKVDGKWIADSTELSAVAT